MFTKQNKCLQHKCLQNKSLQTRYVYKTKHKTESLQNKTKVYKHIMFTNKNTKVYKHVMSTKQNKCLQSKCLQNKTLQTRYVYKTKYKTESLQNKSKVQKHVIFIKEKCTDKYKDVMFTKQNTKQKFTNTICLQNKTNFYNTNVYKTKVYKHVMFIKQNTTQKVYKTKLKFTNTLYLLNKNFGKLCLQNKIK